MRRLCLLPFFALVLGVWLSAVARADTISNFSMSSTLFGGPVADGTFVVDETTGTFTSGEVTISYEGQSLTLSSLSSEVSANGFSRLFWARPPVREIRSIWCCLRQR